jgi:hypothetical protein
MNVFSPRYVLPRVILLALLVTGLVGFAYVSVQQVLRLNANDPQIELSEELTTLLEQGTSPDSLFPQNAGTIDMTHSLSVFVIVYDDNGKPVAGNAALNGSMPVPPSGVLDFVRAHQEERVTWQPGLGLRFATIVRSYKTANGSGFVLVGRSLREVEKRESQLMQLAGIAWGALMATIVIGVPLVAWSNKRPHQAV